jgi:hypothetical protein
VSRRKIVYQNWIADIGFELGRTWLEQSPSEPSEPNPEIIEAVREAIDMLSPIEREFVDRYYFRGQTYMQIAVDLAKKPSRIEGIHRRAMGKLKKQLAAFAEEKFGIETQVGADCVICNSPFRKEIDAMINAKKEEETWKNIISILKARYGIEIKTPQVLIGHKKYHLT